MIFRETRDWTRAALPRNPHNILHISIVHYFVVKEVFEERVLNIDST